jgi:hypothetical protein
MRGYTAAIIVSAGIDRRRLHAIIMRVAVSADYCERLTPLIRDIERGRIAFRCLGPISRRFQPLGNRRMVGIAAARPVRRRMLRGVL